ncbi:unnamed protein product [Linum tenue]|uniref:Uncharacterized protein n=1 Tax=Linum tenue TaxID=586396 RepID=A0AAV0LZ82_9ROSI|nr:unnamed protein product [Linum tenue]
MADDIANKSCSYRSSVDTSRPFSSVKEAVAIFGERFLLRDIYHSTPHQQPPTADSPSWKSASASPSPSASPSQLKEQGSETEIALASLNAELHMNMARMAQAEAAAAKKAADGKDEAAAARDDKLMMRMVGSPTLAQILNLGSEMSSNGYYSNKKMKADGKKKKPIVPLVGDFLYWKRKKDSRSAVSDNPLYGSPNVF